MSFEDDHHSSCARKDEFQSRIARDLHPHGSAGVEIGKREEAFEQMSLPAYFFRLCRANNDTLVRNGFDPDTFDSWQLDLMNYRVPTGFHSLGAFVEFFSDKTKDKTTPEKPYYKVVYERRKKEQ